MLAVTLYNRYENPETNKTEWRRTVLSGLRKGGRNAVHWEDNRASNVISSGLAVADAVTVMIWFDVSSEGRAYVPPSIYAALSPTDAIKHWTLSSGHDRLLKGEGPEIDAGVTINTIASLDGCITITSVDARDFGSRAMWHWEVSGK